MTTTLYYNCTVVTLDPKRPRASALLVGDGRVVGFDEPDGLVSSSVERVNLAGATIVPGFNDCHMHILSMGLGLRQIDLRPAVAPALANIVQAVADRINSQVSDGWVMGRGYNQNLLAEGRHPNRYDLDPVSQGIPVVLTHTSGHVISCNSSALQVAGITRDTPNPEGGEIEREQAGEPTGVLKENAMRLVRSRIPDPTREQARDAILAASRVLAGEGITSATDAATGQHERCEMECQAYLDALETGQLSTRIALMPVIEQVTEWSIKPGDLPLDSDTEWLQAIHCKIFTDGALTTRTAAMTQPYADSESLGILTWDEAELRDRCRAALALGWELAAHGIGDRAIQQIIDVFETVGVTAGKRSRIEHATICSAEQIASMKKLGVTVVLQPEDIAVLGDAYPAALGRERADNNSPVGSFQNAGVPIAFSSDRPVTPGHPLVGIQAAVERQTASGVALGSGSHSVSAETALRYYTAGAAFASGDGDWKGTLAPGQAADFVVLDRDVTTCPPDEISSVQVLRTVVGGACVFEA